MEILIVFADLLDQFSQLLLLGIEFCLDFFVFHQLLLPLLCQFMHFPIFRFDFLGRLVYALSQLLLELFEPLLVLHETVDLGLNLLDLALAACLQQRDVFSLLSYLPLELLTRLLQPLDLFHYYLLIGLPQLTLETVVFLQL